MNKILLTTLLTAAVLSGLLCGFISVAAVTGEDACPDASFRVGGAGYSVYTNAAEILRGKSSFLVTVNGPPTEDAAGPDGWIKITVSGGSNLGLLPGQEYILYNGDFGNVQEFYVTKIPASGAVNIQFVTSPNTEPACYKIMATFPNRSTDYVKVKIVRYFGELEENYQPPVYSNVEVVVVNPKPASVVTPAPTPEPTEVPTPVPATPAPASPLGTAAAVFSICAAFVVLRRN